MEQAEIMRQIRHPNLTLYMGVSIQHPYLCLITEFVEKGSLFELIQDTSSPFTV